MPQARAIPIKEAAIEAQISSLLSQMTADEKLSLLGGNGYFSSIAIPRLGIPSLEMTDGPQGVANAQAQGLTGVTAFPAPAAMAASWNKNLVQKIARGIASEAKALGKNMLLGPCVNIQRVPQNGRNFESFSEDPFLAAEITAAYVRGVQGAGVISTVKHFALNNQELDRLSVDVRVDARAMHEIYFPAFKASVDAGTWAVMSSYNKVNGDFASENKFLLNDILKNRWGFLGLVVSDWGATYQAKTVKTVRAGLDLEMPWPFVMAQDPMRQALGLGKIKWPEVNEKVRRILRAMISTNLLTRGNNAVANASVPPALLEENKKIAQSGAEESIVLLKNNLRLLPLDAQRLKSIAILGPNAKDTPYTGGGSAKVNAWNLTDAYSGILAHIKPETVVNFADGADLAQAVSSAAKSTVAVVFAGLNSTLESEGFDRKTLALPPEQIRLIKAVAAANKNTIVVLNSGGMLLTNEWSSNINSILQMWYAGQEGGAAIANILFGLVNPSGRLPASYLAADAQSWVKGSYPSEGGVANYSEGIFVGYRFLEKEHIIPAFPFGFGLSYSNFTYTDLKVTRADSSLIVEFNLTNLGSQAGATVTQVYTGSPGQAISRPLQELRGFEKIFLNAGESRRVRITIPVARLGYFDVTSDRWNWEKGPHPVYVGESSADLRLRGIVDL